MSEPERLSPTQPAEDAVVLGGTCMFAVAFLITNGRYTLSCTHPARLLAGDEDFRRWCFRGITSLAPSELRLGGFARYRITGFQPFERCYVAPAQTQQLTDDFVEHLAQRFGLSRDAAGHALGELLFYYHDVRQRRAQALKQRETRQVSHRITATWKLETVH